MHRIIQFQQFHIDHEDCVESTSPHDFNACFIESLGHDQLDRIMHASHYLDLQHLLDVASFRMKFMAEEFTDKALGGRDLEDLTGSLTGSDCVEKLVVGLRREFGLPTDDRWCSKEERERMVGEFDRLVKASE